ncbi:SRPBCC family protein [Streptacidiphilus griseoplanus]|uniref:SRPBCC family protein n=1 Tax=Peterkaempfera griseoplana TaxID=66896 RepID=UPI0006E34FFD|nr:SRPBCC family protein [Peterkaempfera griseoplana]
MRALHAVPLAALSAVLVLATPGLAFGNSKDDTHVRQSAKAPYSQSLTCGDVHPDETAPVITRKEIVVNAPLQTVWKVQTDVENWPTWQPNVTSLVKETPGALRSGSVFRWATEGLDITSTVKTVEHDKCLAWGGPAQGINAIHVWTFTPVKGGVLVRTEESWTGAPVVANTAVLQAALDNSLQNWVNNLKHRSESDS